MKGGNILTGIIGGVFLSVLVIYVSYLPYLEFQKIEILLLLSISINGVIVAGVILYKNNSFKFAALRLLTMMIFCYVCIRFLANTGVIEAINNFLLIQENEANSRVSGLGMVFLLISILCESAIIGIVLLFKEKILQKVNTKTADGSMIDEKKKTGDSSVP